MISNGLATKEECSEIRKKVDAVVRRPREGEGIQARPNRYNSLLAVRHVPSRKTFISPPWLSAPQVEDSVDFADKSPSPPLSQLLENVFADPKGFGIAADGRYHYERPGFTEGTAAV